MTWRIGDGPPTVRVDEIDEESLEPSGRQIRRAFANRARLAAMRPSELLGAKLARAMPIRLERRLGGRGVELVLDGGTKSVLPATAAAAKVVERLDGSSTLKRLGADPGAVRACRELLELGAVRFA